MLNSKVEGGPESGPESRPVPRPVARTALLALLFALACGSPAERSATPKAGLQPRLPTGNYLDPAGHATPVGNFPLSAVLSPEGDRVVLLLNGWREEGIQVVERATGRITQTVALPATFIGLAFAPDGKALYASGGNQDVVYRFDWANGTATLRDSIRLAPNKNPRADGTRYPAGVRVSRDGRTLYVAENLADSLAIVDLISGSVVQRVPSGRYPYDVVEDADGNVLVSAWGDDDVVMIGPRTASDSARVLARINAGRHPSAILLSRDKSRAYVASASTDRVSIIDVRARKVVAQLYGPPATGPGEGSTPNALALSPDEQRLYVAEADNNAVAVWSLANNQMLGRVPVEWYPTALIARGDSVLVVNGKGKGTGPNPALPHPGQGTQGSNPAARQAYTLGQINGSITTLTSNELNADVLNRMTQRVARANGWGERNHDAAYPPFEHVIYIIKENRTYDQVLGDMPQGDGDTALVYFPRSVSPNHHALAERFGLFDRFFVNAEVSADGHNWTTAAYTTDYVQKTVPTNYSDHGRSYDYEGYNRDRDPAAEGEDDAAEPANGYLWDLAARAKITLRNYGEYVAPVINGSDTTYRGVKPYLVPNTNPRFPDFNMSIPDQVRADIYLADLREFEKSGQMPQLEIIRLPNDHTSGARAGARTPRAHVADNDLALGRIIEALSRTPFWKNTVVFVLEDDAQNGPDHFDSHRSPLFVVSAYNRGGVIHRFANTTDVIATIAEILKLGSLSQFDYHGRPLREIFAREPDLTPYTALTPQVDLGERNPARGRGAIESQKLKLAKEDQSDDDLFNRILWTAIKGDRPFPGATRMNRLPVPVVH